MDDNRLSIFVVLLIICINGVVSFPQGAPVRQESCINLQPIHRDPQTQQQIPNINTRQAPYRVLMSQQYYVPCQNIRTCQLAPMQVVIRGLPNQQIPGIGGQGTPFRGFIIQARTPSGGTRSWGRFVPYNTGDSKVIQCQNGQTLTHTVNNDKQEVRFTWIPEPGMREQVQFVSTIVQNLRTIYPLVYSDIAKPSLPPQTTTTTTTTTTTAPNTTTTTVSTTTTTKTTTTTQLTTSTAQSSTQDGTTSMAPDTTPLTGVVTTDRQYSSASTTSATLMVTITSLLIALL